MKQLIERLRDGVATDGDWREHTYDGLMLEASDALEQFQWRPIADMPDEMKDGRLFWVLNHDREIWVSKHDEDGRILFRTNGRREPSRHVKTKLADGSYGMVEDKAFREENECWENHWTFWTRMYEFNPVYYMPLPTPPEAEKETI